MTWRENPSGARSVHHDQGVILRGGLSLDMRILDMPLDSSEHTDVMTPLYIVIRPIDVNA